MAGAPGPRIFSSRRGESEVGQIVIPEVQPAAPQPRRYFVRARPLTESNPLPPYPEEARAQGLRGTVYLRVTVSAEGRAEAVDLLLSSRSQILDDAAIAAVKEWAFEPARTEQGPTRSVISVPVTYSPQ
jgi:protein TonB